MAFIQGDKTCVNEMKRELKHKTKLAKLCYKNKMEERFTKPRYSAQTPPPSQSS